MSTDMAIEVTNLIPSSFLSQDVNTSYTTLSSPLQQISLSPYKKYIPGPHAFYVASTAIHKTYIYYVGIKDRRRIQSAKSIPKPPVGAVILLSEMVSENGTSELFVRAWMWPVSHAYSSLLLFFSSFFSISHLLFFLFFRVVWLPHDFIDLQPADPAPFPVYTYARTASVLRFR